MQNSIRSQSLFFLLLVHSICINISFEKCLQNMYICERPATGMFNMICSWVQTLQLTLNEMSRKSEKAFTVQKKKHLSGQTRLCPWKKLWKKQSGNAQRRQICKALALGVLPCLNPFWTMWVWAEGFLPIYSSGWHQSKRLLFLAAAPPAVWDQLETQRGETGMFSCAWAIMQQD